MWSYIILINFGLQNNLNNALYKILIYTDIHLSIYLHFS